ncbi:MAG: hypothetical protein KC917_17535, partial [Candidatus Omnitrophica bacterium]|nr:hypothetical protein [Candidatus Omnitrophota bacterium]
NVLPFLDSDPVLQIPEMLCFFKAEEIPDEFCAKVEKLAESPDRNVSAMAKEMKKVVCGKSDE